MKVTLNIDDPNEGALVRELTDEDVMLVGRSSSAQISRPNDGTMSRKHCQFEVQAPRLMLNDLGSTNGTWLNDKKCKSAVLHTGDVVRAGRLKFNVQIDGVPPVERAKCIVTGDWVAVEDEPHYKPGPFFISSKALRDLENKPQPIKGYQILKELGRGGMGVVYLARTLETTIPRLVVIKVIIPDVATDNTALQMFNREMNVLAELTHPNIVMYIDHGQCEGLHYFVMEYVDGRDARAALAERQGKMDLHDAVEVVCQCLDALDYAHAKKFVHRDIKPPNILVCGPPGDYQAKLLDFGLAKNFEQSGCLTKTGLVRGTVAFMPPEQVLNSKAVGPSADLYAMGAVFYYLLSGQKIFDFDSGPDDFQVIRKGEIIPLANHGVEISEPLWNEFLKSVARSPDDRHANAHAMKRAFRAAAEAS